MVDCCKYCGEEIDWSEGRAYYSYDDGAVYCSMRHYALMHGMEKRLQLSILF